MRRKGKYLSQMCAPFLCEGDLLPALIKGSTGGKKLEFPYEIPPVKIDLEPTAQKTLLIGLGFLGASIAVNGVFNYLAKK